MKWLWILFGIGVVSSAFTLSEAGQALLVVMMLTIVGIPFAFVLMIAPVLTGILGLFLITRTILAALPGFRRLGGVTLFCLCSALVAAGLTLVPMLYNQRVQDALPLAVADDVPLSEKTAPGLVVGVKSNPAYCSADCAQLLMAAPDIRVVVGRFEQITDGSTATPPAKSATWALVPSGIGLCEVTLNQAPPDLRIALAEAELRGQCIKQVAMADQIDVIIQHSNHSGTAPGQNRDDRRLELFLRQGGQLDLAFRRTDGHRELLSVPVVFFSANGYGLDPGLSLAPPRTKVKLQSPATEMTRTALLETVLPGQIALPSYEAFGALSPAQAQARLKQVTQIRSALDRARHDAALAALRSGAPEVASQGYEIGNSYLQRLGGGKAELSDVPLLVAMVGEPARIRRSVQRAIDGAPASVLMPVVDAAIDRLIAVNGGLLDRDTKQRLTEIFRLAERQSGPNIAPRLARLDQLVSTPLGRDLAGGLTAVRGLLGPAQASALFSFLDARIADDADKDGFRTIFRGLCLMGPEGRVFLPRITQRLADLAPPQYSPNPRISAYNMVLMGLQDAEIAKVLRIDRYQSDTQRAKAIADIKTARKAAEKTLKRTAKRDRDTVWQQLCK
ncbi:hypothetical protein [Sulfitobacter mediterraneus]|uniref:Uncharacterized protein n=1 Tax=Sulfitobacter mediterraneus TaxID=83219 RepID=A0A061SUU3_9RHOB|nr:hypothetical protein [Sulfitobacter mediterraneus]KAJ03528.1 hypothetical protein PM02_09065 [Sulfitobacter mediterraneus]